MKAHYRLHCQRSNFKACVAQPQAAARLARAQQTNPQR